ncbi:MAG: UDP-N-acetylmuramoyl-tripeptide--D-alanyl-D-alanine ligase [Pseudoxanthomonas sp.]
MRRTPLSLLAHWAGAELHGEDAAVDAVSNDSRTLMPGSLYVALRGERFDGHDFAAEAVRSGAIALLVDHPLDLPVPQLVAADTLAALARLAHGVQQGRAATVVALTGSNGKTTVKSLLLEILRRHGRTYANPGNRNNEVGLPLAVIEADEDAQFAIYEMGAGKPGDIEYLTDIVRPDVALVNNVAAAHLERLGTLLGVAQTKGAVYRALPAHGVAVVNADDAFAEFFIAQVPGRSVIRFGLDADVDVGARAIAAGAQGSRFILATLQGEVEVELALPGRHNLRNALAAAALAMGCGVPLATIAAGLAAARPVAGRQTTHALAGGAALVDDSYNANPGSLAAAIDTLGAGKGEAWLVLGDMRELGADAPALHAAAGRHARQAGIARLYALGELAAQAAAAFGEGGRVFGTHAELAEALRGDLVGVGIRGPGPGAREKRDQEQGGVDRNSAAVAVDLASSRVPGPGSRVPTILIKGSRGSAMDRVVRALLDGQDKAQEDTAHAA